MPRVSLQTRFHSRSELVLVSLAIFWTRPSRPKAGQLLLQLFSHLLKLLPHLILQIPGGIKAGIIPLLPPVLIHDGWQVLNEGFLQEPDIAIRDPLELPLRRLWVVRDRPALDDLPAPEFGPYRRLDGQLVLFVGHGLYPLSRPFMEVWRGIPA